MRAHIRKVVGAGLALRDVFEHLVAGMQRAINVGVFEFVATMQATAAASLRLRAAAQFFSSSMSVASVFG